MLDSVYGAVNVSLKCRIMYFSSVIFVVPVLVYIIIIFDTATTVIIIMMAVDSMASGLVHMHTYNQACVYVAWSYTVYLFSLISPNIEIFVCHCTCYTEVNGIRG